MENFGTENIGTKKSMTINRTKNFGLVKSKEI